MNFLNYSLTAIICYLGLFIGFALAIIAKEELKAGKRYFILLQKIILLLVFIFLLIYIKIDYIIILLTLTFIIIHLLKNYFKFNESIYIYIILAIIFYLSSKILNLWVLESSLIFLYGLPTGSLLTNKDKKQTFINILKSVIFIIITIALYFIF